MLNSNLNLHKAFQIKFQRGGLVYISFPTLEEIYSHNYSLPATERGKYGTPLRRSSSDCATSNYRGCEITKEVGGKGPSAHAIRGVYKERGFRII